MAKQIQDIIVPDGALAGRIYTNHIVMKIIQFVQIKQAYISFNLFCQRRISRVSRL